MFKFIKAKDLASIVEAGKREKEREKKEIFEKAKKNIQTGILKKAKKGECKLKYFLEGKESLISNPKELEKFFTDLGYKVKLEWCSYGYYLNISWEQEE